jgi:hypothetical protein
MNLSQNHVEFLRKRAVADDVAAARGYRTAQTKSELAALGFGRTQQLAPALVIPIWSVSGEVAGYVLRPDAPRLNEKGKPRKYEMKAGGQMVIDTHPFTSRSPDGAPPLIADPVVPLFVTEGPAKADSALSAGLCCIALLGVWNWRGTNEAGGKTALADWESVALNGRRVYLAFDSDAMEKPAVHAALTRLKSFLESRHAEVRIIYLPPGERGEKVGLDDFIAARRAAGAGDAAMRSALLALASETLRPLPRADAEGERPQILLTPGHQPEIVDAAERVLVAHAAALRIFQRAGEVVRVICLDQEVDRGGVRRPAGTVQLAPVSPLNLQETLDRLIAWLRPDPQTGDKPADCPARIAATYLARIGEWKLPVLTGVIEAPTMRPDGSILSAPGHDAETGLFLQTDGDWPAVPGAPTRDDALAALRELLEPFAEFPFVDEPARAVFVAAILTALQRRLLESAPLFAFDAPAQRSGKSLLAESLGIFATGRKPAAVGVPREADEFRKAITSALRENQAHVNLDNVTRPLDSPDLARAITQSEYADRLLGVNRLLRLPTNILWTATGNNLVFHGDLPTRALVCRIDPQMERPEERQFRIVDLPAHLRQHRRRLVAAALTVLRAYYVAGRPRQGVRPWGGFDQWSREIREPLVWLGLADPCTTREQIISSDPERELTAEVLRAWHAALGEQALLAREVIATAGDGGHEELRQALLAIAARRDNSQQIDSRRLGRWLASKKDKVVDGLRLTPDHEDHRAQAWQVSLTSLTSFKPAAQTPPTHTHAMPTDASAPESACASPPFDRRFSNSSNSSNSPPDPADGDIELCIHGEDSLGCRACVESREDVESREYVDDDWEEI